MPSEIGGEAGQVPSPARRALRDQEALWAEVLKLASAVETALITSIQALTDSRAELAAEVKDQERLIDRREVQIEQEGLRILVLYDLVASDLRRIVTALKINDDLERMADLAVSIAKKAKNLASAPTFVPIPEPLMALTKEVQGAVRDSFDALVKDDTEAARAVIAADRQIDRKRHAILRQLKQTIRQDPERAITWLRMMSTARHLSRIADHTRKIAANIIYMKERSSDMLRANHPRDEAPTARPFRPTRSGGGVLPPRGLFVAIACAGDRHFRLRHQEERQSIQIFPLVSSSWPHLRPSTPVLPEFLNPVNRHIRSRTRVGSPSIR